MPRRRPLALPSPSSLVRFALAVSLAVALAVPPPVHAGTTSRVVLTSPVAGGRWVRPETGLLVRFDVPPAAAPLFTVTGSRSGAHEGSTVLADGGRAAIFHPARPFAYDERVSVTVADAAAGGVLRAFEFSTSSDRVTPLQATAAAASFREDPAGGGIPPLPLPPTAALSATGPAPFTIVPAPEIPLEDTSGELLFLAPFTPDNSVAPSLLIQDNLGSIVFQRTMPRPCFDFKLQPDGRMSYFDSTPGKFMLMNSAYVVVDSVACGNGYATDAHELRVLPNGHYLLLGIDPQVVDMSAIVPGGNPAAMVAGNVIQELDENKNVVFEWRTFDHFQITDATHEDLTAATIDDVHANALDMDTDGNILMSSRHLDEITKIDHATGDIVWRMGGKNNQFSLFNDTMWFSHQHAIRRIANGHVTLFDNGNFHTPPYSRALEYSLDEQNKVATCVWKYDAYPAYGFAMGYVQRLADGSTLVSLGAGDPDAIQVSADGSGSSVLHLPAGEMSYRILHQGYQPVSVPGDGSPVAFALSAAVPNPSHGTTSFFVTLSRPSPVALQVFDVNGRRVLARRDDTLHGAGVARLSVDLSGVPAGVYFARVATNAGTATRRLVRLP